MRAFRADQLAALPGDLPERPAPTYYPYRAAEAQRLLRACLPDPVRVKEWAKDFQVK